MIRRFLLPATLAVAALAAFPVLSAAQSQRTVPPPSPAPQVVVRPPVIPLAFESWSPLNRLPVELRSPGQMTEPDRELEAGSKSSIAGRADFNGLEFNQGSWSYRQVVCPAFPNHLFLRFTRNQGAGDVSIFTASIPRNGEGRVRIIPILRRSYSLFSPAPVNPLTIAAFNRIRQEEHAPQPPAWVAMGLCYAALAGANPQIARPDQPDTQPDAYLVSATLMNVAANGAATLRFTDVSARPQPMEWLLTFDPGGKLIKVTRTPAQTVAVRKVPAAGVEQIRTVPSGAKP